MDSSRNGSPRHVLPRVSDEAEFIPFGRDVVFVKNPWSGTFAKLTTDQADIARALRRSGSDRPGNAHGIALGRKGGTQSLLSMVQALGKAKLLEKDEAPGGDPRDKGYRNGDTPGAEVRGVSRLFSRVLVPFAGPFNGRAGRSIGAAFLSTPFQAMLVLLSAANTIPLWGPPMGLKILPSAAAEPVPASAGAYALNLLVIWASVCLLISAKNLLSAWGLRSRSREPLRPSVRWTCGLVYLHIEPTDIVGAGVDATTRLCASRLLFPFAVMGPVSALLSVYGWWWLAPVRNACFLTGLVALSPLAKTDMNAALHYLSKSTADFTECLSFLRRHLVRFMTLGQIRERNADYCETVALLTLGWLVAYAVPLVGLFEAGFQRLAEDSAQGTTWETGYLLTQAGLTAAPLVYLLIVSVMIAVSNTAGAIRAPLQRVRDLSAQLASSKSPPVEETAQFLHQLPLFAHLDPARLRQAASSMQLTHRRKGAVIVLQGDRGDAFYVVVKGRLSVSKEDAYGRQRIVEMLCEGDSFGEIALIENVPRTATVTARSPVALLRLSRASFSKFVHDSQGGVSGVTDMIQTGKLIMQTPLFSSLSPRQLRGLIARVETQQYSRGQVIFEQQQEGDSFFLIKDGEIRLRRYEGGSEVFSALLGKGQWFGEIALLKKTGRTMAAEAETPATLLRIGKEEFIELLGGSLDTAAEVERTADTRLAELARRVVSSTAAA